MVGGLGTKLARQGFPLRTSAQQPDDAVQDLPVIPAGSTWLLAELVRTQQRRQLRPQRVIDAPNRRVIGWCSSGGNRSRGRQGQHGHGATRIPWSVGPQRLPCVSLDLYCSEANLLSDLQTGTTISWDGGTVETGAPQSDRPPAEVWLGASANEPPTRPTSGACKDGCRGRSPFAEGRHPPLHEGALQVSGSQFVRVYSGTWLLRRVACSGGSCDVFLCVEMPTGGMVNCVAGSFSEDTHSRLSSATRDVVDFINHGRPPEGCASGALRLTELYVMSYSVGKYDFITNKLWKRTCQHRTSREYSKRVK